MGAGALSVAFLSCSSGALYVSEPDPPSTRFGSTLFAPLTLAVVGADTLPEKRCFRPTANLVSEDGSTASSFCGFC